MVYVQSNGSSKLKDIRGSPSMFSHGSEFKKHYDVPFEYHSKIWPSARKAILIDPPMEPTKIMRDLSVDPLLTKIITIPRLQYIRTCSLKREKPFESREIVEIFEEAFR